MTKQPRAQRAVNANDPVAASFAFSCRGDGAVLGWDHDATLGLVLGPSFSNCCDEIVQLVEANTGWSLQTVNDPSKPLRRHLLRSGVRIGTISGFRLGDVAATEAGVLFKNPEPAQ